MLLTKRFILAALCLTVAVGGLDARNVFVMPGSGNQTINVFTADPLGSPATIAGSPGSFLALARPDGARFYLLARDSADSLVILDSSFNVLSRKSLGEDIKGGVVTPDGRRLLVLAGTLRVFDTATGNEIVPPSTPDVGAIATDLAVSQDSKRAFVLSPSAQRVIAFDISGSNFPILGSVFLGGGEYSGIAAGPNGYIYASLQNQVVAIDPVTITRLEPALGANGLPGRLSFSPDGLRAIAVNRQSVTGSTAFVFDLVNKSTATIPIVGQTLEEIAMVANNRAIASSNGKLLYDIALSPPSIAQANFAGLQSLSGVTGFAMSNELPAARYLYVAAATTAVPSSVSRVDLTNNIEAGRVVLGGATGKVSFAGPVSLGPAISGLAYNSSQSVLPGTALVPMIARFLDAEGKPVAGAAVAWNSSVADILGNRGSLTTQEGFVQALVTAPLVPGTYTVEALSGTAKVQFGFIVTTTTGGGGGSVTPGGGGIFIYAGNGQLVPEQASAAEPMVVEVRNPDGTPLANQQVTFEHTQGLLSLFAVTDYTCSGTVCTTDAKGRAGIGFTTSLVGGFNAFSTAVVTARLPSGASVPFNINVYLRFKLDGSPAQEPTIQIIKPLFSEKLTGAVGSTQQGAIQVQINDGGFSQAPIPGVGIRASTGFEPTDGPTVSCPANLLSDSKGLLSCDLTFGGKLGQADMSITVGANRVFRRAVEVTVGAPSQIRIVQGNNQSGNPGQKLLLPVYVEVSDVAGNLLPGAAVTWEVAQPGTLTLTNVRNTTDVNGRALAEVTLGQTPGVIALRVKAGTATVTFTFTVNVRITKLEKTGGDGQEIQINQPFPVPLGVQVFDDQGRAVPGAQVAFSVVSGSAMVSPAVASTGANGIATASVSAGPTAGAIQVRAAIGTLTQVFNLTSRLPGPVIATADFRNAASLQTGLTPGGLVIIRGTGIATGIQGVQNAISLLGNYPTQFNGIEIQFGGVSAPILYASNQGGVEEVAIQVPFEVSAGTTTVTIRSTSGASSTISGVQVLAIHPGLFESVVGNQRFAVAVRSDGSYVDANNPAQRGEVITFFVTGVGQTTPALGTNRPGIQGQSILAPVLAGLNDSGVPVVSATAAVGRIGVYAISIEVPATATPGPAQNLGFAVQGPDGNYVFSNGSVIPIR